MKLLQMQNSPDAFDSFIKQKLEETEVDASLAQEYWKRMPGDISTKYNGFNKKLFFILCVVVLISMLFFFVYGPKFNDVTVEKIHRTETGANDKALTTNAIKAPGASPVDENKNVNEVITYNTVSSKATDRHTGAYTVADKNIQVDSTVTIEESGQPVIKSILNTGVDHEKDGAVQTIFSAPDGKVNNVDSVAQKKSIMPVVAPKKRTGVNIIW